MVSKIVSLVMDSHDPEAHASFWAEMLGWEISSRGWQNTPAGRSGITIRSTAPQLLEIDFRWVPDATPGKNRLHLDLNPLATAHAEEADRLRALGAYAADVGQGGHVSWQVLRDPLGLYFCLCRDTVANG